MALDRWWRKFSGTLKRNRSARTQWPVQATTMHTERYRDKETGEVRERTTPLWTVQKARTP